MGRLKRKRPISSKKKGRKKGEKAITPSMVANREGADLSPKELKPEKAVVPEKVTAKPIKPTGRKSEVTFWAKATQFLREVKIELKKVTWPTKKETMASTVVVIVLVMIVSAFLGLVDVGLSSLIGMVLR